MKRIIKGPEPKELQSWREANAGIPQNLKYGLGGWPTEAVRKQMLAEQGYLCAYTMLRTETADDCHIEHVIPQKQPNTRPHLDIDYNNMLACFPGNKPPKPPDKWNPKYPYGAQSKDGTHIEVGSFISPLQEDVEHRFHYAADGSINAVPGDNAADNSIRILNLNHGQLVELRKAAIDEWVFDDDLLALADVEALSNTILEFDSAGRLPAFCLAISHVAAWYANKMNEIN